MTGLLSKRQQARNEKVLQDLIKSVPGNDRCADCGAKNPGWASWSLGVFLCMTCAALHRKMGTHVSKVKSLSMDSWSNDQVENMKRVGNNVSNLKYNPKSTKPDIPIDADEVGGAMERYIRRKYELREFSGGSARRATITHTGNASVSSSEDPPPPLPPKPGKKFGFALRSASATFSRPRADKFTPPMSPALSGSDGRESPPRQNKASRVFGSSVGNTHDDAFKAKMTALREMGFHNAERNSFVLKETNGSLSAAVETLVRLGDGTRPGSRNMTPVSAQSNNGLVVDRRRPSENPPQAPPKDQTDPFAALDNETQPQRRAATMPVPLSSQTQPRPHTSYNPFLPMTTQPQFPQALQDSFAGMQLSAAPSNNPYDNSTYATATQQVQMSAPLQQQQQQQQPFQYTQPLQAQHTAQPLQAQHTSNPFLRASKSQTFPQSNPFFQQSAPLNPWLTSQAPVQSPAPQTPMYQGQGQTDFFNSQQQQYQPQQQQPQPPQQQYQTNGHDPSQSTYAMTNGSNPFYTQNAQQPQLQQQPQPQPQQFQQQQQYSQPTQNFNPYQSFQAPQQQMPQQNRHDKASILQLYNYPQMAPARPLQALPEESAVQPLAAPPQNMVTPVRSVTMPVTGSMNPFMTGNNAQATQVSAAPAQNVYSHTSRDSMAFVGLGSGRQSPDAFAGLSARYGR